MEKSTRDRVYWEQGGSFCDAGGPIVPTTAAVARSFAKSAHAATEAIFIAMTAHQRCGRVVKEKLTSDTDQQTMVANICELRDLISAGFEGLCSASARFQEESCVGGAVVGSGKTRCVGREYLRPSGKLANFMTHALVFGGKRTNHHHVTC